jgi:hypothetical protein
MALQPAKFARFSKTHTNPRPGQEEALNCPMAKSREKIQQLGLWDPEVTKPDHDAVCLWAYDNADLIFRTVCPERFDKPWLNDEVRLGQGCGDQSIITLAKEFANANPRPNPRVSKRTLEYVLKTHTGYQDRLEKNVGFADLLIETQFPLIAPSYREGATWRDDPIFDGFELTWGSEKAPRILVEAKSVLPTVGELMRQIQLYRTAFKGKFVVVSPDDSYAKILSEQDVTFVKCGV